MSKLDPKQTKLFDLTTAGLNEVLKRLVEESGIQTIGKVHFHLIRKWLMSRLVDAGLVSFENKLIMGKSIGNSDETYLQSLKKSTLEKYRKCYPLHLSLTQELNGHAKYSELVDLTTRFIKAQSALVTYMQNQNLLDKLPTDIRDELKSVNELSQIMRKKNGDSKEEKEENHEE